MRATRTRILIHRMGEFGPPELEPASAPTVAVIAVTYAGDDVLLGHVAPMSGETWASVTPFTSVTDYHATAELALTRLLNSEAAVCAGVTPDSPVYRTDRARSLTGPVPAYEGLGWPRPRMIE